MHGSSGNLEKCAISGTKLLKNSWNIESKYDHIADGRGVEIPQVKACLARNCYRGRRNPKIFKFRDSIHKRKLGGWEFRTNCQNNELGIH